MGVTYAKPSGATVPERVSLSTHPPIALHHQYGTPLFIVFGCHDFLRCLTTGWLAGMSLRGRCMHSLHKWPFVLLSLPFSCDCCRCPPQLSSLLDPSRDYEINKCTASPRPAQCPSNPLVLRMTLRICLLAPENLIPCALG